MYLYGDLFQFSKNKLSFNFFMPIKWLIDKIFIVFTFFESALHNEAFPKSSSTE
jgi:hypothetical protein